MKISTKLLAMVVVIIVIMLFALSLFNVESIKLQERNINWAIEKSFARNNKVFNNIIAEETDKLAMALTVQAEMPSIKDSFLGNNRQELYEKSKPLFEKLNAGFELTHFYFILPNGTVFLRVHKPEKYGDMIDRITLNKSKETKQLGTGLEFGPLMYFTLRVVSPYYSNYSLIGYIEFGMEINHILRKFKKIVGSDVTFLVEKKYIDSEQWKSALKEKGLDDNWNKLQEHVVISSTYADMQSFYKETNIKSCFSPEILKTAKDGGAVFGMFEKEKGWSKSCGGFPLYDAGKRAIGVVVLHEDISDILAANEQASARVFIVIVVLAILTITALLYLVSRSMISPIRRLTKIIEDISTGKFDAEIDAELKKAKDEVGDLARAFERTTVSLKLAMKRSNLKKGSLEKEKEEK